MDQYIHDNTDDEFTHQSFINFYLGFKGATPVNLDKFRTLPSSKATGAKQIGRLTNLMQLKRHQLVDEVSQQHQKPGS